MNLATVIVLLIVLGLVVLAICTLRNDKGSCSCGGHPKEAGKRSGCTNCSADCPFRR